MPSRRPTSPHPSPRKRAEGDFDAGALTITARKLRRNATEAERLLWRRLREAGSPWRVRRQHAIGGCIVDFAVPARKLAIELDGGQHAEQVDADARRTAVLEQRGWRVIRFWNNDVLANPEGVIEMIRRELGLDEPLSPSPPDGGEGGGG